MNIIQYFYLKGGMEEGSGETWVKEEEKERREQREDEDTKDNIKLGGGGGGNPPLTYLFIN
jgi:hypothetical protein